MKPEEAYKWLYVHFAPCGDETKQDEAVNVALKALEKQIPRRPKETEDKAWGITVRQAVCPVCDYYLPHVEFLGEYACGRRVTYCDTCGQAIDWEGWNNE